MAPGNPKGRKFDTGTAGTSVTRIESSVVVALPPPPLGPVFFEVFLGMKTSPSLALRVKPDPVFLMQQSSYDF
jgi:hypothetical protein